MSSTDSCAFSLQRYVLYLGLTKPVLNCQVLEPFTLGVDLELALGHVTLVPAHTHVNTLDMFVNITFFVSLQKIIPMKQQIL